MAANHIHDDPSLDASARLSDPLHDAVREELNRLLASSRFCSSHRCQALLQHVVEHALAGKSDHLKERAIGAAVFGRELDYNTNNDAVVRIAAGEVRKKLAQYYYEPAHQHLVRIELPPGNYVPVFSWLQPLPRDGDEYPLMAVPAQAHDAGQPSALSAPKPAKAPWHAHTRGWIAAAAAALCLLFVVFLLLRAKTPDDFTLFWAPVMDAPSPVLLCVGHRMLTWSEYGAESALTPSAAANKPSVKGSDLKNRSVLLLSDSITLSNLTGLLREHKKPFSIRGQAFSTFGDLQKSPVILIGAFNNKWAMRLMEPMRFHFDSLPNGLEQWIVDEQAPTKRIGRVRIDADDFTTEDYALVARTFDPQTMQPTIIIAGVTATATYAAGDFITSPAYLNEFFKSAPRSWNSRNLELLIVTKNVNGESGPPRVVASHLW